VEAADLERELVYLGFTQKEAAIYLTVLRNPDVTGYQVSKQLSLTKSTVYGALNSLFERGAIHLVPGEPSRYHAKEPRLFFGALKEEYERRADALIEELEKLDVSISDIQFQYVTGQANTLQRLREAITAAQKEIYISCHLDLHAFAEQLIAARARGVRVIVFTYDHLDFTDLDLELHQSHRFHGHKDDQSIIVVADMRAAMIAYGNKSQEFSGTYSENAFFVTSFASYFNLDLVALRIEESLGDQVDFESFTPDTLFTRMWFNYGRRERGPKE
jgi:sugar-specific transcriptional regulator TrmB